MLYPSPLWAVGSRLAFICQDPGAFSTLPALPAVTRSRWLWCCHSFVRTWIFQGGTCSRCSITNRGRSSFPNSEDNKSSFCSSELTVLLHRGEQQGLILMCLFTTSTDSELSSRKRRGEEMLWALLPLCSRFCSPGEPKLFSESTGRRVEMGQQWLAHSPHSFQQIVFLN